MYAFSMYAFSMYACTCMRFPDNQLKLRHGSPLTIGPHRPDAIHHRDANFQFSMTFKFSIFLCFSNIRNHLSNFSYLVCICCKIFIRWRFYLILKTENSRRVIESRSVCMGLKTFVLVGDAFVLLKFSRFLTKRNCFYFTRNGCRITVWSKNVT
jgi:hypothetical protein